MNATFEMFNLWAGRFVGAAWPMLWQSSVLIGIVLVMDLALRRKARAAVRYALWLVVLVKLVLPPSLALPSGVGWWVRRAHTPPPAPHRADLVVRYGSGEMRGLPRPDLSPLPVAPASGPSAEAWGMLIAGGVSLGLLGWMLVRWRQVAREIRSAMPAPEWLERLTEETSRDAGLRRPLRVGLTEQAVSPAVCGLLRPMILLPKALVEQLPAHRLRAVLMHELIHYRRGDLWVNCVQALLQVVYWWHPLVWAANARIRRVREEAVDDGVMLALEGNAEDYAPTLLEVAKLSWPRPLAGLGFIGILESKSSLRRRIERLLDFRPPRSARLTLAPALAIVAFSALALPMAEAPAPLSPAEAPPAAAANGVPAPAEQSGKRAPGFDWYLGNRLMNGTDQAEKAKSATLQRDGKLLFEMGKLDEAERALEQATRLDPANQAAHYYLNLVQEAQSRQGQRLGNPNWKPPGQPPGLSGRMAVYRKLDKIHLDQVGFDDLPLREVVQYLNEESQKRDPDHVGVTFRVVYAGVLQSSGATNQPQAADVSSVPIRISPPLHDIRLADLLDAIVKVANQPIQYSIENDAVSFAPKIGNSGPLYTRIIKVDPPVFVRGLEEATGENLSNPRPGEAKTAQELVRRFFQEAGVDFKPPKAVFLNESNGALLVRASLQDLDFIEQAVNVLNTAPAQVHIRARFFEVPEESAFAVWNLAGQTNVAGKGSSFTMLLTEPELPLFLKAMEAAGAVLVNEASVTTLSGRQAQIQVVEMQTIATNINPRALSSPGVSAKGQGADALILTTTAPFGPTLDVVPFVSADGESIQLTTTARMTEFLGYGPTNFVTTYVEGKRSSTALPLPHFRARQVTTTAVIPDGVTLLLGTAADEPDSTTLTPAVKKKRLLAVLTPTIIDAAGNRVR